MIIKDLIKEKDYDYISIRSTTPKDWDEPDIFIGCCKSKNGKLISLDGDSYSEDEEVIKFEEWSDDEIKNGLTIVVPMIWMNGEQYSAYIARVRELRKTMSLEEALKTVDMEDFEEYREKIQDL